MRLLVLPVLLLLVTLLPTPARANDAGLSEIASAVRYAELHFGRDPESASRALDAIKRAPELVREGFAARYAKGRLLEKLGRTDEALAAWPTDAEAKASAATLGARVTHDLRLRRARALAALKRCDEALSAVRALESEGAFAAGVLSRARCPDPAVASKPPAPLTLEQRMARAEKLTSQGRGEEALALLDAITKGKDKVQLSKAQKARFTHLRGMALFRMRTRYAEAARVLQAASQLKSDTAEEDAFHAARAIARSNENVRAAKAMRAFTKRFPKSKRVSEALYLAAWLELRVDHPGAEKALASWLDGPLSRAEPALAAEAQVELGMRALHAGKHAAAAQRFAQYAASASGCLERGRGLYWGARAELAQKKRAEAVALLNEATQVEPLCWYALLARGVLKELGEALPAAYPSALSVSAAASLGDANAAGPDAAAPDAAVPSAEVAAVPIATGAAPVVPNAQVAVAMPREAAFYAALGFDGDAVSALREAEAQVRAAAPAGYELQALVGAYEALGEHARPRALVHQAPQGLLTRAPTSETAFALRAAYARPHRALVQTLAASERVEEELIYAVMLKESAFDPRVVSNADAIGLMQLLPNTGKLVGRDLGLTVTRETLYDPEDNIRLGVRLLKQLLKRYDGQMALAVAAYNAGAHRVDEWLARAAKAPDKKNALALDRFVEDIPIDQTRNYVRRVTAFYARYKFLGPDGTGGGPILELPAEVSR